MRYFRLVALLIAALALVESCSGSTDKASQASVAQANANTAHPVSAPISNPCALLTQEEASAAIGQKIVRNDLQHDGPVSRCRFFDASGDEPLWLDAEDAAMFDGLAHLPDTTAKQVASRM